MPKSCYPLVVGAYPSIERMAPRQAVVSAHVKRCECLLWVDLRHSVPQKRLFIWDRLYLSKNLIG